MTTNPEPAPDTVEIPGCSDPIPRQLYAKITNVSGCPQLDGKVVKIFHESETGNWRSADDDLVILFSVSGSLRTLCTSCVGESLACLQSVSSDCVTSTGTTFSGCSFKCCGDVDIHIGKTP